MKNYYQLNKQKYKETNKRSMKKRLLKGLCGWCLEKRLSHSVQFCEKHWFRDKSYKHFKSGKFWEQLKEIAEQQNYTCPYTGDKLIPGFNMSLDHIISKSEGGVNTVDNVQWVTWHINVAKSSLSHAEFIELCKKVANRS